MSVVDQPLLPVDTVSSDHVAMSFQTCKGCPAAAMRQLGSLAAWQPASVDNRPRLACPSVLVTLEYVVPRRIDEDFFDRPIGPSNTLLVHLRCLPSHL